MVLVEVPVPPGWDPDRSGSSSQCPSRNTLYVHVPRELDILPPRPVLFPSLPFFGTCRTAGLFCNGAGRLSFVGQSFKTSRKVTDSGRKAALPTATTESTPIVSDRVSRQDTVQNDAKGANAASNEQYRRPRKQKQKHSEFLISNDSASTGEASDHHQIPHLLSLSERSSGSGISDHPEEATIQTPTSTSTWGDSHEDHGDDDCDSFVDVPNLSYEPDDDHTEGEIRFVSSNRTNDSHHDLLGIALQSLAKTFAAKPLAQHSYPTKIHAPRDHKPQKQLFTLADVIAELIRITISLVALKNGILGIFQPKINHDRYHDEKKRVVSTAR